MCKQTLRTNLSVMPLLLSVNEPNATYESENDASITHLGHVHIIYEDNETLPRRWTVGVFSSLFNISFEVSLHI